MLCPTRSTAGFTAVHAEITAVRGEIKELSDKTDRQFDQLWDELCVTRGDIRRHVNNPHAHRAA